MLDAFDGGRYVLDPGSSKVLRLLLEHPEGRRTTSRPTASRCGSAGTAGGIGYFLRLAPAAVSRILELAACPAGTRDFNGVLPPIDQDEWSCGKRRVWLRASPSAVALHIRDAESDDTPLEPTPPPLPETMPSPRFMNLPVPAPSPHCGVVADSFRHLYEGSLVCGSCGGSFEPSV